MIPERADARIGHSLGRYVIRYHVAHGGMASVYLAQLAGAHQFQRWVAVKVMHTHLSHDSSFIEMFLDEARLAAQIQHPNVCQVIDFGEQDGTYFIVMEYLHGETLSQILKRSWAKLGELPSGWAARVTADIARGLHAAHELRNRERELLNLVHRDVSPQNMMVLYDGVAKITDFGIARARGRISSTQSGVLKGKFAYMSPEQLNGEMIDRQSDVWALGVVLWESSLGQRLFRSQSEGETALKVVQGEILAPTSVNASYPKALEEIVMAALERDRAKRTRSAGEMAAQLDDFLHVARQRWGPPEVGDFVTSLFPDRLTQRDAMLDAEDGVSVEAPLDLESTSTLGSHVAVREPEPSPKKKPAGGVPWFVRAGLVVTLLAVIGAVLGWALSVMLAPGGDTTTEARVVLPTDPPETPTAAPSDPVGDPSTATGDPAGDSTGEPQRNVQVPPTLFDPVANDGAEAPVVEAPVVEHRVEEDPPIDSLVRDDPVGTAPTKRRPRVRPATPVGRGTLNLLAIPRSEVTLRGRVLGTTPLVGVELPSGRHRLVVRALDGSGRQNVTVVIRADQRTSQSVRIGQ